MTATVHRCPVCRRPVTPTRNGHNIRGHYDHAHNVCPASYHPYDITLLEAPPCGSSPASAATAAGPPTPTRTASSTSTNSAPGASHGSATHSLMTNPADTRQEPA